MLVDPFIVLRKKFSDTITCGLITTGAMPMILKTSIAEVSINSFFCIVKVF